MKIIGLAWGEVKGNRGADLPPSFPKRLFCSAGLISNPPPLTPGGICQLQSHQSEK